MHLGWFSHIWTDQNTDAVPPNTLMTYWDSVVLIANGADLGTFGHIQYVVRVKKMKLLPESGNKLIQLKYSNRAIKFKDGVFQFLTGTRACDTTPHEYLFIQQYVFILVMAYFLSLLFIIGSHFETIHSTTTSANRGKKVKTNGTHWHW